MKQKAYIRQISWLMIWVFCMFWIVKHVDAVDHFRQAHVASLTDVANKSGMPCIQHDAHCEICDFMFSPAKSFSRVLLVFERATFVPIVVALYACTPSDFIRTSSLRGPPATI